MPSTSIKKLYTTLKQKSSLHVIAFVTLWIIALTLAFANTAHSQKESEYKNCDINNRACILQRLEATIATIENRAWRDQTLRELAKTLASDGKTSEAMDIIEKIETPDTKALTIRGIGMAAAENDLSIKDYDLLFEKLRIIAEKIDHPPSYAIALTYIAMSQAFAGDNEGAWQTANDMENDALRNKAYGETAEIQAEQGKFNAAMQSIKYIESESFRNKAYGHIAKILADNAKLQESYEAAEAITNAYKKATAFQYILDAQTALQKKQQETEGLR